MCEAFLAEHEQQVAAAQQEPLDALAEISRQMWSTPATTFGDIVARAELVSFWGRPLSDEDWNGYEAQFAEKKLVDALLAVAVEGCASALPAFEPPPLLIDYRHLDALWEQRWLEGEPTNDERFKHIDATYRLERALLKKPASCWADIAMRAELTAHHRNDCRPTSSVFSVSIDDGGMLFCPHHSFAELLLAVMRLGNCVWPIDNSDVVWEHAHRELWAKHRAKSRVYHAEVMALRKDWRNRVPSQPAVRGT